MYANGTFKNPFTDFDFTKIVGEFKLPTVNVETIVETTRKNFAALTTANTAAVESFKNIGLRQSDMVRAVMEDFSKHGSEVLAAATLEEIGVAFERTVDREATPNREFVGIDLEEDLVTFPDHVEVASGRIEGDALEIATERARGLHFAVERHLTDPAFVADDEERLASRVVDDPGGLG